MASTETGPAGRPSFGALAASALGYWEPRRLVYNGALALVVVADVAAGWPASRSWLTANALLGVFSTSRISRPGTASPTSFTASILA